MSHAPEADTAAPADPRRRMVRLVVIAVVVAIVAVIVAVVWFLAGDAPEEVDITSATAQVETSDGGTTDVATGDPTPTEDAGPTADAGAAGGATDGVWSVDPSIGTFSITESTGTFVGVRVDEVLARIGETTAVVRTPEVTGAVELDGTTLTSAAFEADFTTLVSDETRRENAIQRALNTDTHPTATFALAEPVDLGSLPTADAPAIVDATGDLTVNGVTNAVQVPLDVVLVDGVAVITGTFDITFADYGVQAPTAPAVLSVEDHGTVELQLFLSQS